MPRENISVLQTQRHIINMTNNEVMGIHRKKMDKGRKGKEKLVKEKKVNKRVRGQKEKER